MVIVFNLSDTCLIIGCVKKSKFLTIFYFFLKIFLCKYEVLKYKAWTETYTNALAPDCEDTEDGWIQAWNLLLVSDLTNLVIPKSS